MVGEKLHDWLVDLYTRIFLDRADEAHREERRARLEAFFDASIDCYVAALQAGYPEAEARGSKPAGPAAGRRRLSCASLRSHRR